MKKQLFGILALIVSITLLISLVSCSNKPSGNVDDDAPLVRDDSTGSTSAPENNAGNVPDFSAIMAGPTRYGACRIPPQGSRSSTRRKRTDLTFRSEPTVA